MNKPESPLLRTLGRAAAITALFATAACEQAASDRAPEPSAPGGAPAPEKAGHREVVDVTDEVERLAKMVLEEKVTEGSVPALLTRNENRLLFVDHELCGSPGANGFVLNDGRAGPHPDSPMVPVPTHPATYAMASSTIRDCPDNRSLSPILDGELVWNNAEGGAEYGRLRAIYVKLMARLGTTVDPEPWNSQEAKDRAKKLGVDEKSRMMAERADEETTAKGK